MDVLWSLNPLGVDHLFIRLDRFVTNISKLFCPLVGKSSIWPLVGKSSIWPLVGKFTIWPLVGKSLFKITRGTYAQETLISFGYWCFPIEYVDQSMSSKFIPYFLYSIVSSLLIFAASAKVLLGDLYAVTIMIGSLFVCFSTARNSQISHFHKKMVSSNNYRTAITISHISSITFVCWVKEFIITYVRSKMCFGS